MRTVEELIGPFSAADKILQGLNTSEESRTNLAFDFSPTHYGPH
jgi:hypothetical protein